MPMLSVPVVFIIFNRPNTTVRVWQQIKNAQPPKLYIIADGPRQAEEKKITDEVRAIVEEVNWPCKVVRMYREQNLGCRFNIIKGLNDVFAKEESAIILEDDCLPHESFFGFCEALLQRYRYEHNIMHIGGNNFQFGHLVGDGDYYFSTYSHIWGWATWKRAWQHYKANLPDPIKFMESNLVWATGGDPIQMEYWKKIVHTVEKPGYSSWDYHWLFAVWQQKGICIVPNKNLVINIGFEGSATHTIRKPAWYHLIKLEKLVGIRPPSSESIDAEADKKTFYSIFLAPPSKIGIWQSFKNKVKVFLAFLGWKKWDTNKV